MRENMKALDITEEGNVKRIAIIALN